MKKLFSFIVALASIACLTSCEEKVQVSKGKVKRMTDSTVTVTIDKYDIVFHAKEAHFANGALIPGDSTIVSYIGNLRDKEAKALIFELIPPKGHYIEPGYDENKKLETAPMTDKEKRDMDEFVRLSKKHGH